MKKKLVLSFFIVLSILILINSHIFMYAINFFDKKLNFIPEDTHYKEYYHKLDDFGIIEIFNLTVDKTWVEIGENISVSTVYSLICNAGYQREYGKIGINKPSWFEYRNNLIDGVELYNVTEIISISPDRFDGFDVGKGRVEIKILNKSFPEDYKIFYNETQNPIEIRKAQLNFTLIEQSPTIIFSDDLVNLSIFIFNEHSRNYVFSNGIVHLNISNGISFLNLSEYTDSEGLLNFTLDCSLLGAGNYIILLENNETDDYESSNQTLYFSVLDKDSCINCTLLNHEPIYTDVDYDDSNYSKIFFLIESQFAANINYSSIFDTGNCSKIGEQYFVTLNSPTTTGLYQINFIAQPILIGKCIEFNYTIEVKNRPTELNATFFRYENQQYISFLIKIKDKLVNQTAKTNQPISITANYNNTSWNLGTLIPNSDGSIFLNWNPPNNIQESYISFNFKFNSTPVYQNTSLIKNMTITKLLYTGPIHEFASKEITLKAVLFALNGTPLPNTMINLIFENQSFNLTTNLKGEIFFSFVTPSHATTLQIQVQYIGSGNVLSSNLIFNIKINLDFLQQIWDSIGFILLGISLAILSLLYLKKLLNKKNLATLDVT